MSPTSKLYHQLIIAFMWVPALLALFTRDFRLRLKQSECWLYGALAGWVLTVLLIHGAEDPIGEGKMPFLIGLSLAGIVLAAQQPMIPLERLLLYAGVFGGLMAGVSWVYFYIVVGNPMSGRLSAIGVWNAIIMASHAVGALAVMGVFMLKNVRLKPAVAVLLLFAGLGYAAFLASSQTRGVWIALAATLVVMAIALKSRRCGYFILVAVVGIACIAAVDPEILLQRGVSYRPELWHGGVQLIRDHWMTGVGFDTYLIQLSDGSTYKHPHNLFLDTGVRLGVPGLILFLLLWVRVGWRGWACRDVPLGQALLALWVFASVSLLTDGIGLWFKPNADWLITWLPIGLSLVLAGREGKTGEASANVSGPPL
ncbi:O-antigen ligase family protein [Pseudomonas purpurea]|uniref:O-antigen ligase family protein n=1 Tax=Pseudomonas purpurea TaxID=3136737 RepID=UPI0032653804